jgi:hypothetical protein
MTHDRGGPALIGAGACIVLIADLVYAASHWSGSFPRGFLVSLTALSVVALVSLVLRLIGTIGKGRRAVRWNQRVVNIVLVVVLVTVIEVNDRVGGNGAGEILGAIAGLAGAFTLYTAVWLARARAWRGTQPGSRSGVISEHWPSRLFCVMRLRSPGV